MAECSPAKPSKVSPEELAERQRMGAKYEASKELARVTFEISGHRVAINTLIREEKRLVARAEELNLIVRGAKR